MTLVGVILSNSKSRADVEALQDDVVGIDASSIKQPSLWGDCSEKARAIDDLDELGNLDF